MVNKNKYKGIKEIYGRKIKVVTKALNNISSHILMGKTLLPIAYENYAIMTNKQYELLTSIFKTIKYVYDEIEETLNTDFMYNVLSTINENVNMYKFNIEDLLYKRLEPTKIRMYEIIDKNFRISKTITDLIVTYNGANMLNLYHDVKENYYIRGYVVNPKVITGIIAPEQIPDVYIIDNIEPIVANISNVDNFIVLEFENIKYTEISQQLLYLALAYIKLYGHIIDKLSEIKQNDFDFIENELKILDIFNLIKINAPYKYVLNNIIFRLFYNTENSITKYIKKYITDDIYKSLVFIEEYKAHELHSYYIDKSKISEFYVKKRKFVQTIFNGFAYSHSFDTAIDDKYEYLSKINEENKIIIYPIFSVMVSNAIYSTIEIIHDYYNISKNLYLNNSNKVNYFKNKYIRTIMSMQYFIKNFLEKYIKDKLNSDEYEIVTNNILQFIADVLLSENTNVLKNILYEYKNMYLYTSEDYDNIANLIVYNLLEYDARNMNKAELIDLIRQSVYESLQR